MTTVAAVNVVGITNLVVIILSKLCIHQNDHETQIHPSNLVPQNQTDIAWLIP